MSESVSILLPEAVYAVFDTSRDGLPAIVIVNQSLLSFPHSEIFAWRLSLSIEAAELADNGMPTPEESAFLSAMSERFEDTVLGGLTPTGAVNALFLARSTWNGWRDIHFYVHNPEIAHLALQALLNTGYEDRPWSYSMEEDADWSLGGQFFQFFAPQDRS